MSQPFQPDADRRGWPIRDEPRDRAKDRAEPSRAEPGWKPGGVSFPLALARHNALESIASPP
ncbi:hypothetical protein [Isosphaera pallida]|uniref:hypothetical protein n=1 Tax=Isosphaera pallida TaxID=128 RepID=UPI0003038144|nr:hypothetical protein [Isosphaera pallida]